MLLAVFPNFMAQWPEPSARVVQYWLYHWLYQYDSALTVSAVSAGWITGCITGCITVCIMAIIIPHYNLLISTQMRFKSAGLS